MPADRRACAAKAAPQKSCPRNTVPGNNGARNTVPQKYRRRRRPHPLPCAVWTMTRFCGRSSRVTWPATVRHRDHLRMAWLYVRRLGQERRCPGRGGTARAGGAARSSGALLGDADRVWVGLVAHHLREHPTSVSRRSWTASRGCSTAGCWTRTIRRSLLAGETSRRHVAAPDRRALPAGVCLKRRISQQRTRARRKNENIQNATRVRTPGSVES